MIYFAFFLGVLTVSVTFVRGLRLAVDFLTNLPDTADRLTLRAGIQRHVATQLDQVQRFTQEWERRASLLLRQGNPQVLVDHW